MFKKAAVFTDIHFGLKSNSKTHNDDCEEFVDWYIEQAQANGCETGIFMGDWHHNRNSLNITTLDATLRALEKLGKAFEKFYFFPGNHDLYYKDKRDLNSVAFGKHIEGITMVNEIMTIGDSTLVPWLVGDEWKKISKLKSKYVFGHFELPSFYMNAMVQMPDHGELKAEHFKNQEYVFSGHFHKRQVKGPVHYIGNALPHNYADAWDDDRGMMIIDYGKEPKFINWPDMPRYITIKVSELLEDPDKYLKPKMYVRVTLDIKISYEEANFVRETFIEKYQLRELQLIPEQVDNAQQPLVEVQKFDSVDQIVIKQLQGVDSEVYDKNVLTAIYNDLDVQN